MVMDMPQANANTNMLATFKLAMCKANKHNNNMPIGITNKRSGWLSNWRANTMPPKMPAMPTTNKTATTQALLMPPIWCRNGDT